jgi:hypothetical protein
MSQSTNDETTGGIPAQTAFLDLLGKDIEVNPDRLQAVDTDFVQLLQSLVQNVAIDLDERLLPDND